LRTQSSRSRRAKVLALALLLAIPTLAAAAPRRGPVDLCVTTPPGDAFNALLFQDVPTALTPGRSIELHGLYFTHALKGIPFSGSAAATADGTIRVGIFVHSSGWVPFDPSSTSPFRNDFTLSGVTDGNLAGTLNFDNDGDYLPNGLLTLQAVDCATLTVP
jgi:hypothetical protein